MTTDPIATWQGVFQERTKRLGDRSLVFVKEGEGWNSLSWNEFDARCRRFARALIKNEVQPGTPVAILSANRWQWGVADFGSVMARCIGVGIYPTNSPEQCEYILSHSEARVTYCDTKEQTEKILSVFDKLTSLKTIITGADGIDHPNVIGWDEWMASGEAKANALDKRLDERIAEAVPDENIMFVYTSGTTGPPKCVQLTHANTLEIIERAYPEFDAREGDTCISYLPPAHVADRLCHFYLTLYIGGRLAYIEKVEEMITAMTEIHPTSMLWVPRIYEKVYGKIQAGLATASPVKKAFFSFASNTGKATAPYRLNGKPIPFPLSIRHALAKKLVYDKLNKNLFGGSLRFLMSGAAPLSKEVAEFFFNLGVPILEGWAMSETGSLGTLNRLDHIKFGSVGQPLPGVEIKIDADGEVLIRGVNVMKGYYKNDAANEESFTPDGWFRTGDIGRLDEDGFLYITDRKKELIITSSGKNISPQNIENYLKQNKYVSLAMAHGNDRNFISALITLDMEELLPWAESGGLQSVAPGDLYKHEKVIALIKAGIDEVNERLSRIERVKKFAILPEEFSIDAGEITPTLKLKRRIITEKYRDLLDGFYRT